MRRRVVLLHQEEVVEPINVLHVPAADLRKIEAALEDHPPDGASGLEVLVEVAYLSNFSPVFF